MLLSRTAWTISRLLVLTSYTYSSKKSIVAKRLICDTFYGYMLTDEDVNHIAKLARINLEGHDTEKIKKDLSAILDYIEKLNEVDTSAVEPLYQTTGLVNATRADEPRGEFPMTEKLERLLLDQAPARKDRFVKVKSILPKK
jgi:aspartyl-tRNA(Asn)/glutamyl-tRNA(Gln) amidotransferase subunit C